MVYRQEGSKKSQIRRFWGKLHFGWSQGSILVTFWHHFGVLEGRFGDFRGSWDQVGISVDPWGDPEIQESRKLYVIRWFGGPKPTSYRLQAALYRIQKTVYKDTLDTGHRTQRILAAWWPLTGRGRRIK